MRTNAVIHYRAQWSWTGNNSYAEAAEETNARHAATEFQTKCGKTVPRAESVDAISSAPEYIEKAGSTLCPECAKLLLQETDPIEAVIKNSPNLR